MSTVLKTVLLLAAVVALAVVPRRAGGTLLPFLEMEELTGISDLIVLGKVESVESGWTEGRSRIRTRVTLEVEEVFVGSLEGEKLTIVLPGGYVAEENLRQVIPGIPEFEVGEETIVFLRKDESLLCPVAGWVQGKFEVIAEAGTGRKVVVDRLGKYRRYAARKGEAEKEKRLGEGEAVSIEEFAAAIAEIQGKKGNGK